MQIPEKEARRMVDGARANVGRAEHAVASEASRLRQSDPYLVGKRLLGQLQSRIEAVSKRLDALQKTWLQAEETLLRSVRAGVLTDPAVLERSLVTINEVGSPDLNSILAEIAAIDQQLTAIVAPQPAAAYSRR